MASPPSSRRQKPAVNQALYAQQHQPSPLTPQNILPAQPAIEGRNELTLPAIASPNQLTSSSTVARPPPPGSPSSTKKRKMDPSASAPDPVSSLGAPGDPGGPSQASEAAAEGSSAPPAKKTRTNTPWTPAEEKRLKELRDAGTSWSKIAETFPNRTEGSVKKHWYKDMHYAEFAEDESAALLEAIREYDAQKWKIIGQKVGKPAKACEQYARDHFGGRV